MTSLATQSRFANTDAAYALLADAHRGLSPEASAALNARLVLLLANHIGDEKVLREAIVMAKSSA